MAAPDSAEVIQVLFRDDDELVQALELQRLHESLDLCPQVR